MRVILATLCNLMLAASANALVILQYHNISDSTPPATSISPALFSQHLSLIEDSGYTVVDLTTVTRAIRKGLALPDKTVLITFDDSYRSIYDNAFPELRKRGWPFVVFVNTEPMDRGLPSFMSWQQLRTMSAAGAAIANHSVAHPHMARHAKDEKASEWRRRMREQILDAEQRIEQETGQSHRVLAFPYGEYDSQLTALLDSLGYLGMAQNSGAASADQALALPRFPFGGHFGQAEDFAVKLRALPMPLLSLQIADDNGNILADGSLSAGMARPQIIVELSEPSLIKSLQCYASGQIDPIRKEVISSQDSTPARVLFQTQNPLPPGRSRYNCTARAGQSDRFHWFSVPFLRPNADGRFPPEP